VADVNTRHTPDLSHHLKQGLAWLSVSEEGENTTAISYAGLELRFAIERLAIHYWIALLDRKLEAHDIHDIGSFKRIENRIYELGGHQKEIDDHFEFMRIVHGALKIDGSFSTPHMGKLSKYWHACSEYCHIAWPLSCSLQEARNDAFENLTEIATDLTANIRSLGWPILKDVAFVELRNNYINGEISSDDVLKYLKKIGVWAVVKPSGEAPAQFVGTPIPPDSNTE